MPLCVRWYLMVPEDLAVPTLLFRVLEKLERGSVIEIASQQCYEFFKHISTFFALSTIDWY